MSKPIQFMRLQQNILTLTRYIVRLNCTAAPSVWVQLRYEEQTWSVEQAQVGLDTNAATFPLGLDTPLSKQLVKEMDVSGGQWQRIASASVWHG